MGFLDTIGQRRPDSRPQSSRPTESVIRIDSASVTRKPPAPERPSSPRNDRIVALGAVLVVIAAVAVAAWLALRDPATAGAPTTEGSGDTTSATPTSAKPEVSKSRSVPAVRSAAKRNRIVDSAASRDTASEPSVAVAPPPSEIAGLTETATAPIETISNLLEAPLVAAVPDDDNVYSGEGEGLVAPRLLSLGFVHRLVTGLRTRTSTIELFISKSGSVERVRVTPPSRNWEDAMLLSRAKTFHFQPAQRNGSPVRYRFVMEVDAAP
jgi:hypothetical protein